ncbi:chromate transporter [Anaerosphaera multitolerans]|uniref:Chromate transporter n=1 Tax=Anaerosphaera multitolerans TaxID=2487351 RepID=A0A437S9S0_9FIRM|nr:chromate transporter [Anaerosphaera multitolerans]RVU55732.1 chromate transporter [Anaerosphaera multitolerans]
MNNLFVQLYLTFLQIGVLAFGGGYATIPLIEKFIVHGNNWLSMSEFLDLISISQMTPGPIAINSATFVGQRVGGFLGSVVATAGFVTPQFIIMMIFGYFLFTKNKKFKILNWILNGIKAGIVSLILISAINLIETSIFPEGFASANIVVIVTFILGFILYIKKVDLFKLIGLGAVLGILLNFIMTLI